MKLKLFKKYFLTTTIIILVSFIGMLVILSIVLNNYFVGSRRDTLSEACDEISQHIVLVTKEGSKIEPTQVFDVIRTVSKVSDTDIFIADKSGTVVVCACEEWAENRNCQHTAQKLSIKDFEEDSNNKLKISTLDIYKKPHYVATLEVYGADGTFFGRVFATSTLSTVENLLSAVTKLYLLSSVVPVIVMFFAIYTMTYRLTKPLKLMSQASVAMARGDFSKRIPVMSDDEIGELSAAFNKMTNSLSQLEGMRKSFVANVSHELKTPMTTIGGFIDGILDGTIEPEKQQYYLGIVSDEVRRLSRLVESMLSMSRLESGEFSLKKEIFDISAMLCSIAVSQEQRIKAKNIEIFGLDGMQSISVNADKDLIYQAIYNLVDNAIKFTEEGGAISFKLENDGLNTVFTISNTGKGIPQKDLPLVFERFYKVDKSRSASKNSTGLGLYIVKKIITAHGGKISLTSREDKSTTFAVYLPDLK